MNINSSLSGQLIVSCQPVPQGPMDVPNIVSAMAVAAVDGGAAAIRIEGVENVQTVRARTDRPIIGLIKRDLADSPVRITPFRNDVEALAAAGADVIAVDATDRPRPCSVAEQIAAIHALGRIAMADCATIEDARAALDAGAEILGSTMSGYTGSAVPSEPDLALVRRLAELEAFIIAEGRYHTPDQAAQAIRAGADAVVVGTALTRLEIATSWFATAVKGAACA